MACGNPLITSGTDTSMQNRQYMIQWGCEYIKVETTGQYMDEVGGRWWECIGENNTPYWVRGIDMIEILEFVS